MASETLAACPVCDRRLPILLGARLLCPECLIDFEMFEDIDRPIWIVRRMGGFDHFGVITETMPRGASCPRTK